MTDDHRNSRRSGKTADEAELVLRRTSNDGLLRAFANLTHRLHAADRSKDLRATVLGRSLRSQRDRVQVEILRRMQ